MMGLLIVHELIFNIKNIRQIHIFVVNPFLTEAHIIYKPVQSMNWFLYDIGLRHERINFHYRFYPFPAIGLVLYFLIISENQRSSVVREKRKRPVA